MWYMPDEKWISKDYIIAWIAMFLLSTDFYLCMVTTSGYAISTFGVSSAVAALSVSIAVCSAIITRVIVGRAIFRIGCIRALIIGFAANAVISVCYFFTASIGLLLAVRIIHGLCIGVASTAVFTVASVLIPKTKSGVGMGFFSLSTTLGTAIGPFIAVALTSSGSYKPLYIMTTIVTLLDVCLVLFIKLKTACIPEPDSITKPPKGLAAIIDTNMLPVALICGLVYTTYGCIVSFLAVSAKGTGLENAAAYFFVLYAAGTLITRPITGRVFDRHGENPMMYSGLAVFAVGMLLTGLATNGTMLLIAAFLNGAGMGAAMSVTLSIGAKYATPERLGMANATFYIFLDTGLTVGPIIGGLLVPFIGYTGTFTLGMPVALAGIVLYYFIHGRKHRHMTLSEASIK
jgi:MFS family permease